MNHLFNKENDMNKNALIEQFQKLRTTFNL